MPRQARRLSGSGYMHLIVRGIGKQTLFEEASDDLFFLSRLERYSKETGVGICAYCLMENHVHLLVHAPEGSVPLLMKKLGVSYSRYYNRKYERSGHLFQDRYLSEAIEDESYLLEAFRYILKNPEKAGICGAGDYRWSSYRAYEDGSSFVETMLLRELIGGAAEYRAFISGEGGEPCMEYDGVKRDDAWARETLQKCLSIQSGTALQRLGKEDRNAALKLLKEKGLTVRQIERLTGINRGVIQRA